MTQIITKGDVYKLIHIFSTTNPHVTEIKKPTVILSHVLFPKP